MNTGPSAELVQAMYAYYQQGKSLEKVGESFHYTGSAVLYQFRKYNLPTRPPRRTAQIRIEAETRRMYVDYEKGLSLLEVGKLWGFSEVCVWQRFKCYDLPRRPPGQPSLRKA